MDRIEMVRDNFGKMELSVEFWTSVSEISIRVASMVMAVRLKSMYSVFFLIFIMVTNLLTPDWCHLTFKFSYEMTVG